MISEGIRPLPTHLEAFSVGVGKMMPPLPPPVQTLAPDINPPTPESRRRVRPTRRSRRKQETEIRKLRSVNSADPSATQQLSAAVC